MITYFRVSSGVYDFDKFAHQIHGFGDQPTRHTDVDRGLLTIAGKDPDLDTGHLQSMNSVWYAVLKLVLNSRGAEQE